MVGPCARPWMDDILTFLDESIHYKGLPKELKVHVCVQTITASKSWDGVDEFPNITWSLKFWLEDNDHGDAQEKTGTEERGTLDQWLSMFDCIVPGQNFLAFMELFGTQQRGLLGLGPKGVQEGDVLCVLMGLCLPCLLRPVDVQDRKVIRWRFVGVCYVDGLMAGEGLKMGSTQEFTII